MQIEKKEELVKSETVKTVTTYKCPVCGYIDASLSMVERHVASTHLVKRSHTFDFDFNLCENCGCGERTIYWFDSESDLKEWMKHQGGDVCTTHWTSPGWYYLFHHTEPCPRGCCTNSHAEAYSVECLMVELEDAIVALNAKYQTLKTFFSKKLEELSAKKDGEP